jgi:hypothetical protein
VHKIKEAIENNGRTGLNKVQRMARDNADSEDEYDEDTANNLEKATLTEDCQERVAAVPAEVPATVPWHNM